MSLRKPRRIVPAVNPRASFGKSKKAGWYVTQSLRAAGSQVVVFQAQNYQALLDRARKAVVIPAHAPVLVGGDGMVHLGVQVASETGVALGIVPSGTGNDLARHVGIPLTLEGGLFHLLEALEFPPRVNRLRPIPWP